jgi:hypothetical protein
MLPRTISVKHMGSGARRAFEFMGFDARKRTVILRFGNAGDYDFSLRSGQGIDLASYWVIEDLEPLRTEASASFFPGERTEAIAPHRALHYKRARASHTPVEQKQLTLRQVRHG